MRPQPVAEVARALVRAPSVSSADPALDMTNRAVAECLAGYAEDAGFRVELLDVPGSPNKVNLLAIRGCGEGGLVLAGHLDTVPASAQRWSVDPFEGVVRDDRLYGLGAADMKSFFAAVLGAARALEERAQRAPLILVGTADEEITMAGARALVALGRPRGRAAIVGEPTGLRPIRLHKSTSLLRLRVRGRAGHSSDPARGANALDGMAAAMGALQALRAELALAHRRDEFEVPTPTLSFGALHGGDSANRICGDAELLFDLRLLPGMDGAGVLAELRARVADALDGQGLTHAVSLLHETAPAFESPATAPLVAAVERHTGAAAGAVAFGTEAPYYQALGHEVVVLGPGSITEAHQPDEYVTLAALRAAETLLHGLAVEYCT